jgi:hypothetical protein
MSLQERSNDAPEKNAREEQNSQDGQATEPRSNSVLTLPLQERNSEDKNIIQGDGASTEPKNGTKSLDTVPFFSAPIHQTPEDTSGQVAVKERIFVGSENSLSSGSQRDDGPAEIGQSSDHTPNRGNTERNQATGVSEDNNTKETLPTSSGAKHNDQKTDNRDVKGALSPSASLPTNQKERVFVSGRLYLEDIRQIIHVQYELLRRAVKSESHATEVTFEYLDGYICWVERNHPKRLDTVKTLLCDKPFHCLLLYRSIWVLCEQVAHAADRISQIYHAEIFRKEGYGLINDLVAEKLDRVSRGFSDVPPTSEEPAFIDVKNTYHRGLDELRAHKVNFDDLTEVARINRHKVMKTFTEPEGLWSYVVLIRNFWSVIYFNALLIVLMWWWTRPQDLSLRSFALFDSGANLMGSFIDIIARLGVYRTSPYCLGLRTLPPWAVIFYFILFLILLAYFPVIFFFGERLPSLLLLAAILGIFGLRFLYNALLMFFFPLIAKGHYKQIRPPFCQKIRRALMLSGYFLLMVILSAPLILYFIVPTLQNSAFWTVCPKARANFDAAYVQCVAGTLSLWLPILATVLILNYIAYTLIIAIVGSVMANSKGIGELRGENYAIQTALTKLDSMVQQTKKALELKQTPSSNDSIASNQKSHAKNSHESARSRDISKQQSLIFHFAMRHRHQIDSEIVAPTYNSSIHIWWHIIYDLVETDMITEEMAWNSLFREKLYNIDLPSESERAIRFFLSSLSKMHIDEVSSVDLDRLPSLTSLIPTYSEVLLFNETYLRDTQNKKVSNLEFLTRKFKSEWKNFASRMSKTYKVPNDPDWLLNNFLHPPKDQNSSDVAFQKAIEEEIIYWASLRGQTVYRTIRGVHCYRVALELLFFDCLGKPSFERLQQKVNEKLQIILAHQLFGDPSQHPSLASEMKLMMKKFCRGQHKCCPVDGCPLKQDRPCPIDLVFDWDVSKLHLLEMRRVKLEERARVENISFYWQSILQQTLSALEVGKKLQTLINTPAPYASVLAVYEDDNGTTWESSSNSSTTVTAADHINKFGIKNDRKKTQTSSQNSLCLRIKYVIPRLNPLVLNVQGSLKFSPPEIIQGKACNQRNGLLFAWGFVIQTKDANQGGTLAEAVKFPVILHRFQWSRERPAIIGFRERVFTERQGTVARFQAYSEWSFVTIMQRVLGLLGLRMHYGHPDFFDAPWVYSRSAISKASPRYNLSEDIFAGYLAFLHGRRSTHTDRIQDEKGRDVSITSTAVFTAKLAQGAASQCKTRDIFEINSRCDFITQFLLMQGTLGFYLSTTLMLSSVSLYVFGLWLFTLARFSTENLGNMQLVYSVPWLFQIGNFLLIPLLLESAIEYGVWKAIRVLLDVPLSTIFFLFQSQTTSWNFWQSFRFGFATYMPTGRKLELSRRTLTELYQRFAKSHFFVAVDLILYILVYWITASYRRGGVLPLFMPFITALVFIIAPILFNSNLGLKYLFRDLRVFVTWVYTRKSVEKIKEEWKKRRQYEQFWKEHTGVSSVPYNLLQTYNIFGHVESMLKTKASIDFSLAIFNMAKASFWFILAVSAPGQLRDVTIQIGLLSFVYIAWNFLIALATRSTSKARAGALIFWLLMVATLITFAFLTQLYLFIGHVFVALFIVFKFVSAFTWIIINLKVSILKRHYHRKLQVLETKRKKDAIDEVTIRSKVSKVREALENKLIVTVYFGDLVTRPYFILSVSLVLLPIQLSLMFLLAIPAVSDWILYSIRLQSRSKWEKAMLGFSNPFSTPLPEGDNVEQFFSDDDSPFLDTQDPT